MHSSLHDWYYFYSFGASLDNSNQWETLFLNVKAACRSVEACAAFEGCVQYQGFLKD